MKVLKLKISNILSIEEAEIQFSDSGLVLLEGFNHDDGRANGAGKTAIFNALAFGLYGKLPRRITVSEILKKGTKSGYVSVAVKSGSDVFTVTRFRPASVTFENGETKLDITQAEFEKLIGLTYDQFVISMYTAQDSTDRFLTLNDAGKKDFLLRLMDLDEFDRCKDTASDTLKKLTSEFNVVDSDIREKSGAIMAHSQLYIKDISSIEKDIDKRCDSIIEANEEIGRLEQVRKPSLDEYIEIDNKIAAKRRLISDIKTQRQIKMNDFTSLSREADKPFDLYGHESSCPYCDEGLLISGNDLAKLSDIEKSKKLYDNHVAELRLKMSNLNANIADLDKEIAKEKELDALQEKIRLKRKEESREYDSARARIAELKVFIGKMEMENKADSDRISRNSNIRDLIKSLKDHILNKKIKHQDLSEKISIYEQLKLIFSGYGAPAYIMDSVVESFNSIVNDYVGLVWSNASYELRSYKENKAGDIKAKFSDYLIINGEERSIGSLSGGEFRALSLAVDFTMIQILATQFGIGLNPIIMDEPFGGLDAAGRELIINMLEHMSGDREIWVIDHASEAKAMFSKVVLAEKRNGTTTVSVI